MDEPFVMNIADAPATSRPRRATMIDFEPDGKSWPDTGVNVQVMQPGQPNCKYHSEPVQEDFLVLHGECIVILEGEERPLRAWDFVHCPPGARHTFVGTGDQPCVIFMIGARRDGDTITYPRSETACARNAGVQAETDIPAEAYAPFAPWRLGRPDAWADLPWE